MTMLAGKVAVVTGAASGIGARTAEIFVREGARVLIADLRRDRGERLARTLGESGSFIRTDVTVEADVERMIAHAVERFGRLDCLVNNAGKSDAYTNILELNLEQLDAIIAVHLRGVLAGLKHAARVMIAQGSGSIINIGSVAGIRAGGGAHCYSAAKAAAIHITRCAAAELGEKGIRVNSVSPGVTATGAIAKDLGMARADEVDEHPEYAEAAIRAILPRYQPLVRVIQTDDIAQAVVFLASDASRMITGHNLVVDGGSSAGWPIAAGRSDSELFLRTLREALPGA